MEKAGLGEAFPRDEFEKKRRGLVPANINADLKRLAEKGLVDLKHVRWGTGSKDESLKISLTEQGRKLAKELWFGIPEPLQQVTQQVKEMIFPMAPDAVKTKVHKEYPEYKSTYTEEDKD